MADTDIIVSQMPNASQVNASDLVMLTQPNSQAETGYSTAKTTVGAVATKVGNGIEFVTDLSRFNDKTLIGAINENKDSILDLLPVDEVSGPIANFETDIVLPLIDVKAEIKALETGTGAKSPSNPYVISGFTGAKIGYVDFNQLVQNGNFENSDGWLPQNIIVGVSNNVLTINVAEAINSGIRMPISAIKGHKYYKKVEVKSNIVMRSDIDGVGTVSSNGSNSWETLENIVDWSNYNTGTWNFYIRRRNAGETSSTAEIRNCVLIDITQLFGSTIADYLYSLSDNGLSILKQLFTKDYYAYNVGGSLVTVDSVNNEQTCPNASVSWQTEAGEVFGGYYDFTTGKLTATHVKLTETKLRSVNWSVGGSYSNLFGALLGNEYVYPTGANEKGDILSDIYENVGYIAINTQAQAYQIALRNDGTIRIKDNRYATLQDFKDDLGNLNIIVKLATPVEYDLTPQQITPFLGVNNIFNDTNGDTTVKYKVGIQKYIDKKIAEVQALVL